METILITGGAGFIGSHLAESRLEAGRRVVVLDNFDPYYDPAIKRDAVDRLERIGGPRFELVEGDIRDADLLAALFERESFNGVIHLAARAGVRPSIEDPVLYSSVNLDGTTRLLEACRRYDVKKFIFGSSSSVYGNNEKVPFSEDDAVDHPISPYAATKKAGEVLCHAFHHLFGMQIACLRFFTVYGPRQRPEMAIHKFARILSDGGAVPMFGDGTSARDYTFVADIVAGVERAYENTTGFHVWNLGGSRTVTLRELIEKIAASLGIPARIDRQPLQAGDVDRTWADVSRAKAELNWEPEIDIDAGIARFTDWFVEKRAAEAPLRSNEGEER